MAEKIDMIRHSAAHILAAAVIELFPDAKYDIGPSIENGFYYDFDLSASLTADDLAKIEAKMAEIIAKKVVFDRLEVSRSEAIDIFTKLGQAYKLERLRDISEDDTISLYRCGNFVDLCRGPHIKSADEIRAFKLLSIAGCYYRGCEKNKQLQRIYGTAFESQNALNEYIKNIELAKERDHRKLGVKMNLFHIDDMVGQGLILWTPRGTLMRQALQTFLSEELDRQGYVQVVTPHIGKLDLFRCSGHFPYYKESQFPPMWERESFDKLLSETTSCAELANKLDSTTLEGFLLKPMNCPMHVRLYDSQPHSYRDLPIRMAEFGTVYRWEQSGELGGLTRVRGFTQDDAHIFCTDDQIESEITGCLNIVNYIFNTLGMQDYRVRISLRDPKSDKYIGSDELWEKAENALRNAAKNLNRDVSEAIGEAAFYGPKIDFIVRDVLSREWQLGTIQVDYNLPIRFNINYVGQDNKPHTPIMIHRAPFGSIERFCGLIIEHFGGNFPLWLAPEQVRILPINDALIDFAKEIQAKLKSLKIRTTIDDKSDKLGAKIRRAEADKIPYTFVIGNEELESKSVSVRSRSNPSRNGSTPLDSAINFLIEEIKTRQLPSTKE